MTKSNYTPGAWVEPAYDKEGGIADICTCKPTALDPHRDPEEQYANAHLIASAPELLEALIDCREALRRAGATGELKVVDAAIAKARGEV